MSNPPQHAVSERKAKHYDEDARTIPLITTKPEHNVGLIGTPSAECDLRRGPKTAVVGVGDGGAVSWRRTKARTV